MDEQTYQNLQNIKDEIAEDTFYLDWNDPFQALYPVDSASSLPEGILQSVIENLRSIQSGKIPAGEGYIFANSDPMVVETAIFLLYRFAGGRLK